jgi:carbonic anhydrase
MRETCDHQFPLLSRRRALAGAATLLAASAMPFAAARAEQPATTGPAPNAIPPSEALDRLMQGNGRYVANTPNERDFSAARAALAEAQFLVAAIVGCSDSRVVPDLVFDQMPGNLFVVRLAGNFIDDDGFASLEYAVKFLGAPLVMVLGHTNCGAIATAVQVVRERIELPGHLPELIKAIEPAVIAAHGRHPSDLAAAATEENVRLNVKRAMGGSPVLSEALADKKITVSGGVCDIATGKVNLI